MRFGRRRKFRGSIPPADDFNPHRVRQKNARAGDSPQQPAKQETERLKRIYRACSSARLLETRFVAPAATLSRGTVAPRARNMATFGYVGSSCSYKSGESLESQAKSPCDLRDGEVLQLRSYRIGTAVCRRPTLKVNKGQGKLAASPPGRNRARWRKPTGLPPRA